MAQKRKVVKKKSRVHIVNSHVVKIMLVLGIVVTLVVSNVLFTMVTGTHFRSGKNVLDYSRGSGLVKETIIANRGNIYDRNKEVIAQDIEAYNLFAYIDENRVNASDVAAYVVDFEETANTIAPILECESDRILSYLEAAKKSGVKQTEFGELGKSLSAQQKADIEATGLPGLDFTDSTDRIYPTGVFASQMIGFAQNMYDEESDSFRLKGVMGMESIYDEILQGVNGEVAYQMDAKGNYLPGTKHYTKTAVNGDDIYLTIDKNVQMALEKALSQTMQTNNANKAWGVVMEAKTGKVLAQAGYPTFDLNERDEIAMHYNIPSELPFEPGSVLKPFLYAAAIQEGVYNGAATFSSGSVDLGVDINGNVVQTTKDAANYVMTISDAQGKNYGVINFDEGLVRSTNTGIINLLLKYLDPNKNIEYLKKFGFFDKIGMEGINEDKGVLNVDNPFSKFTLGFGQGSTVNAYQLVQAASALFTDGTMVKPYVVDRIVDSNTGKTTYKGKTKKQETGISPETAKQLQVLLKRVVDEEYGTARQYKMTDISMMAKTGTGEVYDNGGYSRTIYTTSMMAAAPSDDPEIIIYYGFESPNYLYYDTAFFQQVVREALLSIDGYNKANEQNTDVITPSVNYTEFTMPSLVNHSIAYAQAKLQAFNCNVVTIGDGSSVISQYPYVKEETISSQKVFLLTDGVNISMPNMSGWSRKDVQLFSQLTGIPISIKGSGIVVSQGVAEKTTINAESKIEVELK